MHPLGRVTTGALVPTLVGFAVLTLGNWLGGTIVYVHGMRVLNLVGEPAHRAGARLATPEKESAATARDGGREERGGLTRR